MDQTAAIAELPEADTTALRARDLSLDDLAIAARLGMELEAVDPLLRLAAIKLQGILAANQPPQLGAETRDAQ
jgi:hypothetical protein